LKNEEKSLRGSPAGRLSDTRGQQPEGVLVLNGRDERAVAWLINQACFDAVQQACEKIAGNRKLYPTNLAKILGLSIPHSVIVTPVSEAVDDRPKLTHLGQQFSSKTDPRD
jgi:hypothetical protein